MSPSNCSCPGCQGLRDRYAKDPQLLACYSVQLLKRGWAGSTEEVEQAYMASHAPWYKAAVERGRQTAARIGLGKPVGKTGEAQTPPAEEFASQVAAQLPLPLAGVE